MSLFAADILEDTGNTDIRCKGVTLNQYQGRSLHNAVLLGQLCVLLGKNGVIDDAVLLQLCLGNVAVGAGAGGEEHQLLGGCGSGRNVNLQLLGGTAVGIGVKYTDMGQVGILDVVFLAVLVLLYLTVIPVLNGTVVTGDLVADCRPPDLSDEGSVNQSGWYPPA